MSSPRALLAAAIAAATLLGPALQVGATEPLAEPMQAEAPQRYYDEVFVEVNVLADKRYRTARDAETGALVDLYVDIYVPANDLQPLRPAVVLLPPGGFTMGDRKTMAEAAHQLARHGFVAVAADYRLRPNAGEFSEESATSAAAAVDATHDIHTLVNWLRNWSANLRINANAIGVLGASAGGIVALDLAHEVHDPPTNLWGVVAPPAPIKAAVALAGGVSPMTFGSGSVDDLSSTAPPVLAIHGVEDQFLRHETVETMCATMQQMSRTCILESLDTDHFGVLMAAEEHVRRAARFLAQELEYSRS